MTNYCGLSRAVRATPITGHAHGDANQGAGCAVRAVRALLFYARIGIFFNPIDLLHFFTLSRYYTHARTAHLAHIAIFAGLACAGCVSRVRTSCTFFFYKK